MILREIRAAFWRGGTSKALVFDIANLPADRTHWDPIFLAAMGSPDPYGRQLDGMGGGISSLSKVCVVGPPTRADADVDFTFAQVSVGKASVDYGGNCGNMISAIGPAALDLGYVSAPGTDEGQVRIHNTNTGKIIVSRFPVFGGVARADGDLSIDGVADKAAPIRLEFLAPGGAKTGALLPTGAATDMLALPDGTEIAASLIDAANPCVFVAASDMGLTGTEHPDQLAANGALMARMEDIRRAGSVAMRLCADPAAAGLIPSIPKVAMVAPPMDATLLSGRILSAGEVSLVVRMISMEQPHRAVPITGAICLALATRIAGSVPARVASLAGGPITIAHPSGSILVDAEVRSHGGILHAVSGTVYRTARKLFSGSVHYRDGIS